MKILITGGAGFVASYLIEECLARGDEVIGTFRWQEDLSRMKDFKDKITLEEVELTDLSSVIRCINKHRPDAISHLAAQSWVPSSMNNPIYTMKNNIESTLNVLEAVRIIQEVYLKHAYHIKNFNEDPCYNPLIHICSSSEFYGKVSKEEIPITENTKANPGNVYGVSKVAGDFLAQIYEKYYYLRILITRMFTHTGVGRTMMSAENYYAREIALREIDGKDIIYTGDSKAMESLRTWADVRDAVKNYYTLFKNGKTGIYNVSGETTKNINQVLSYLLEISNIKQPINFVIDPQFVRKINVDKQIVSCEKYKSENTWSNDISFETLMIDLLNYWRNKISLTKLGNKNPNWNNGSSFEPYSINWTEELKQNIRHRDSYICQLCNKKGNIVHHIDYNKKNCDTNNLITLCRKCHPKTNHNRKYWLNHWRKNVRKAS